MSDAQEKAVNELVDGLNRGYKNQTLLGITGSGKTFAIANVIEKMQRQTLVIAHNKTLAAQLYEEFKELFPDNAVEYFISYYDYYQPEAYIPRTDTYIEKSSAINDEIDRLRHHTTRSLYERDDVIVVASVSCIYGLGLPENYFKGAVTLSVGDSLDRDAFLKYLITVRYTVNNLELTRSNFRARGDVVEILPSYDSEVIRISFFGDEIEKITRINPVTGEIVEVPDKITIFPAVHYLSDDDDMETTVKLIRQELASQLALFNSQNKLLEAQRLEQRVNYDIEMLRETGYCSGVENYSRILERRAPGTPPATLLDYFNDDFLTVTDESHVTIPQLRAMYNGDASRKSILVDYGFRLPCAKDNRPLKFEEFEERIGQRIFVSATPGEFEKDVSDALVEQIIRPTGLLDPEIFIRPVKNQIDDIIKEIRLTVDAGARVLITALTKKTAEAIADYLVKADIKATWLHSEITPIERVEILRDLRLGKIDVLVGVNLLREGLDIPEAALVIITDADKEGFLRSETSLIQTIGRAARNANSKVIMYADRMTDSMKAAVSETNRRRKIQKEYNEKHGIIPKTIVKPIENNLLTMLSSSRNVEDVIAERAVAENISEKDLPKLIAKLEKEMKKSASVLDFEKAAQIRDTLKKLRNAAEKRK